MPIYTFRSSPPRVRLGSRQTYEALARELQLFLIQLRPVWSLERMITHHEELLIGLEREEPAALRRHLRDGVDPVLAGLDAEY